MQESYGLFFLIYGFKTGPEWEFSTGKRGAKRLIIKFLEPWNHVVAKANVLDHFSRH